MQSGEHPTHSPEVVEALCQLADKSELESEESVTEDLQSKLAAQGHQVNTAWIRTTLHSEGYSLRSVRPRSCEELDEDPSGLIVEHKDGDLGLVFLTKKEKE